MEKKLLEPVRKQSYRRSQKQFKIEKSNSKKITNYMVNENSFNNWAEGIAIEK